MAELTIRGVEPEIVQQLTKLAEQHQRSVEEEHKAILRKALIEANSQASMTFESFLASIPDVGCDMDFSRAQGAIRDVELSE